MIISRSPLRVSFFGGGTDYPLWYQEHGGAVLSTTIDKCCYISCRYLPPFFEYRSRIVYSTIELVREHREIRHPAVRAVLEHLGIEDGVEIHYDGDVPARTGLGSSSSFTVGLLHALHALRGAAPTAMQLAQEAIHVEQSVLAENVGAQDQVAAAFGGLNRIDFRPGGAIDVSPVSLPRGRADELQAHLMLIFSGFSRFASEVAAEQIRETPRRHAELTAMRQMVDEALAILEGGASIEDFGRLLHEGWLLKRSLASAISTPAIDEIYENARRAGALGGKLLGAGGGGFVLLCVRPQDRATVLERLHGLLHVPFRMDTTPSQIIMNER